MTEHVWLAMLDDGTDSDIIITTSSRGVARVEAEQVATEALNDPIESWTEDLADGTSECGVMESGRWAIITKRKVREEPREDYKVPGPAENTDTEEQ